MSGQAVQTIRRSVELVFTYLAMSCFRLRRTMCQTVQESVQEMELAHQDPTQVVLHATRKRLVHAMSVYSL